MSPNGEFIVGSYFTLNEDDYFDQHPVVWRDGELTDPIDELPGEYPTLDAINSDGISIGTVMHPLGDDYYTPGAYTYQDGEVIELEEELSSQGWGINDHGDTVGIIEHHETNVNQAAQFIEGENVLLDVPEDIFASTARDIDNDGNIVGYVDEWDFGYTYRWNSDGEGEELTVNDEGYALSDYPAIDNGVTIGAAIDSEGNESAVMWELDDTVGTIIDLDKAHALNEGGWIVGSADISAAAYVDGEVFELPRLDDEVPAQDEARGISDDGSVIAGTVEFDSTSLEYPGQAVTWSCG